MTARFPIKIAAAVTLALLTLAGCGEKKTDAKLDPKAAGSAAGARTVTVVNVELRPIEGGLMASGALISREEAVVSAEVSGFRVARVLADMGDHVSAGQTLVQLDDTLLRAQIEQQTALLAQSEVGAQQAVAQAARVAGLDGSGALAQEQIDQRRFAAQSSQAQARAQAASLKDLQTRVTKMTVKAPVGGTILERTVRPGDMSSAQPMFTIARDSLVELDAQTPESSLPGIRVGSPAVVILPDSRRIQGVVRLIGPSVNEQTRLGQVRVALPVAAGLRPGGFAQVVFGSGGGQALSVPEAALRYDADGVSVMAVGADNKVKEMRVKTGRRGGGFAELIEGPPPGTRVLLGASSFVLEGDVVRPVAASAAPPAKATAK